MSETFLVRGFWGPRAESVLELAERTSAFTSRLERLRPEGFGDWSLPDGTKVSGGDPEWLGAHLAQEIERRGAEGAELGVVLVLAGGSSEGANCTVTATVGVSSRLAALKNSVVVKLRPPETADGVEWLHAARQSLSDLVETWAPDWGDVSTRGLWADVRGKVTVQDRAPRVGYLTYLSSARAGSLGDVPSSMDVTRLPGGGAVVSPLEGGRMPKAEEIIALDRALAACGALTPMPTDRPLL